MHGHAQRGFSALEMLTTVTIAAIVLAIAVPNYRDLVTRTKVAGASEELQAAMGLARAEALKLKLPVTICARVGQTCGNETSWNNGFLLFQDPNGNGQFDDDEIMLRTGDFDQATLLITSEAGSISLLGNGRLAGGAQQVFDIRGPNCTPGGTIGDNGKRRQLTITASGRASVRRTAC